LSNFYLEIGRQIRQVAVLFDLIHLCSLISFRSRAKDLGNHRQFYYLNLSKSHFQVRKPRIPRLVLSIKVFKNTTYIEYCYAFKLPMSLYEAWPISKKRLFYSSFRQFGDRHLWVRNLHLT